MFQPRKAGSGITAPRCAMLLEGAGDQARNGNWTCCATAHGRGRAANYVARFLGESPCAARAAAPHFFGGTKDSPRIIAFPVALWRGARYTVHLRRKGRSATPNMAIELAPSILSANFARLGEEAKAALDGGGSVLHVDVMDGHFVPNITIGPLVVASLRKALPDTIFDCHLMIENPDEFIPAFAEAGATWISVHQEACVHLHRTLQLIESHGCKSGVVLNPATPVHMVDEVLDMVHHVLIMSVNPGFGAQKFIPGALHKIKTLVEVRESLGLSFRIEIDG